MKCESDGEDHKSRSAYRCKRCGVYWYKTEYAPECSGVQPLEIEQAKDDQRFLDQAAIAIMAAMFAAPTRTPSVLCAQDAYTYAQELLSQRKQHLKSD